MKYRICYLIILLPLLMLAACSTFDISDIPAESEQIAPEEMGYRLDYDIFNLRIDIERHKDITTSRKYESSGSRRMDVVETTKESDTPYSAIGIYYGSGFFLDSNRNFSIDVIKLLGLDQLEYFKIIKKKKGLFDTYNEWIKDGNEITIIEKGLFKKETTAVLEDGHLLIDYPGAKGRDEIIISENSLLYDKHTILGKLSNIQVEIDGEMIKLPGASRILDMSDSLMVDTGKAGMLYKRGNSIYYSSLDRSEKLAEMLRTSDGYTFVLSEKNGFSINRTGNEIIIKEDGRETVYQLEL